MKLLLTGSNGNLGKALLGLTSSDWEVECFRRGSQIITPHAYDLVVHCAGVHPRSVSQPTLDSYLEHNVRLTKEIVEGTISHHCRLIFISTSYLNLPGLLSPLQNKLSLYSASKAMSEAYLQTVSPLFYGVYVLRLPVLLAPGLPTSSFLNSAFHAIYAGEDVTLYNAKEPFPISDAEDVMAMVRRLAQIGPKGFHILPLGPRDVLSLQEIIELFKEGIVAQDDLPGMVARHDKGLSAELLSDSIGFKASSSFEIIMRFMQKELGAKNATE